MRFTSTVSIGDKIECLVGGGATLGTLGATSPSATTTSPPPLGGETWGTVWHGTVEEPVGREEGGIRGPVEGAAAEVAFEKSRRI